MDKLHLMNVYVAVAEEGGFAAGARRLGISPPAVTRAVAILENSLGVQLLNRTTRYVRTTEAGERYLEDASRILAEVDAANEAAAGINAEPQGHLAITAPVLFGKKFIIPGVVDYLNRYPKTQVDAVFLDRVVNLVEEGFDVGVRIGNLPDSSMRALPVGHVSLMLCASPDYLSEFGSPQTPEEISQHTVISSSAGSMSQDWKFYGPKNTKSIKIKPRLKVTTNDAAISAAVEGFGITRVISYQVADHLSEGRLKVVLAESEAPAQAINIVHREGRLASTKVRAFIDLIAARLRADKTIN
jgi:DNA-binding transcriptional LysR family regulator